MTNAFRRRYAALRRDAFLLYCAVQDEAQALETVEEILGLANQIRSAREQLQWSGPEDGPLADRLCALRDLDGDLQRLQEVRDQAHLALRQAEATLAAYRAALAGLPVDDRGRIRVARFWVWVNSGWVKVSLLPGEQRVHHTGGPDEEGWHYASTCWTHLGDRVQREESWCSRDCDGEMRGGSTYFSKLDRLEVEPADRESEERTPRLLPAWVEEDSYQRDLQAEAAGY